MNEELKNKFKNGMIPDEIAFGQLIDEATKETDLSGYATKEEIPVVPDVSQFITLEDIPETDLSEYAKVSDIPSLTGLLSESDADALYVRKDTLPNFEEYAKKTDIPAPQDLSNYVEFEDLKNISSINYKDDFIEENIFLSNNLFNRNGVLIQNKKIESDGSLVEDSTMITTGYPIPIEQGTEYYSTAGVYISQFDSSGNFISQHLQSITSGYTPDSETSYIKLSIKRNFIARFMIGKAASTINANDHYVPYEIKINPNKNINNNFTEVDALNYFVEHMNHRAKLIGMNNTVFHNPSGLNSEGQVSSSRDMLKLILNASSQTQILRVWGVKNHTVNVKGDNAREISIETTVKNNALDDFYVVQGGKTGTITSAGYIYNLATICSDSEGQLYATTVLGAPTISDRFNDTKIAIDAIKNNIENPTFSATSVSSLKLSPNQDLFLSSPQESLIKKDEETTVAPASLTKIMTALIMLESIRDMNETFEIRRVDLVGGSGNYFKEGDIISFEDALYLLLLPSSNVVAQALARTIGRKLYYSEHNTYM